MSNAVFVVGFLVWVGFCTGHYFGKQAGILRAIELLRRWNEEAQ